MSAEVEVDSYLVYMGADEWPEAAGDDGHPSTGNRIRSAGKYSVPIVAGTIDGGVMGGPAGAVAGAKVGQAASLSMFAATNANALAGAMRQRHVFHWNGAPTEGQAMLVRRRSCSTESNSRRDTYWATLYCDTKRRRAQSEERSSSVDSDAIDALFGDGERDDGSTVSLCESGLLDAIERTVTERRGMTGDVMAAVLRNFDVYRAEKAGKSDGRKTVTPGETASDDNSADVAMIVDDTHACLRSMVSAVLNDFPRLRASGDTVMATIKITDRLVLGHIYSDVFSEFCSRCEDSDRIARSKMEEHRHRASDLTELHSQLQLAMTDEHAIIAMEMAAEEMQQLQRELTAHDKMQCLLSSFCHISEAFSSSDGGSLGADALMPLLCTVLAESNLQQPHAELAFIEEFLRGQTVFQGQEGYLLTSVMAALHYLTHE